MFHQKISTLSKKAKENKFFIIVAVIAFAGGILGGAFVAPAYTRASIFGDIYRGIVNGVGGVSSGSSSNLNLNSTPSNSSVSSVTNDYEQAVINAVQKASPAVVSIVISKDVPVVEQCPYNPFSNLPQQFQQFFDFGGNGSQLYQPCNTGKTQKQEVGGGSGFIISSDGLILTNKHVVSDTSADYTVFTNDGKKYTAKVLARHPTLDIALVKISATNLPTVELGDSSNLKLGQTSIAIGNALGEFRNTVSVGNVSGLARTLTASDGSGNAETLDNVIQTSAAINPGNSGGPLLDLSGRVIGIDTAMVSGAQNIGFAIPINYAKKSIQSVISSGKISVAYLGVRYIMLTSDVASQYGIKQTSGALIKGDSNNFAVEKNSPAEKAGLQEGDVITKVDGQDVNAQNPLASIISQKNPGDTIVITFIRNGKEMTANVTLSERK